MNDSISKVLATPGPSVDPLTEILRRGARDLLAQAIQAEVEDYIEAHKSQLDKDGRRLVVRNGSMPEREIQTPLGQITVKQPRVNDRRVDENGLRQRFHSSILPPYLRRSKTLEELLPFLYLKGVSTGDFAEALSALLGKDAPGLSPSTITRLKEVWLGEYEAWSRRSFVNKRYVYIWADGIHFTIRLGEDERMCILVVMGATADGNKELLAVEPGYRESEMSWQQLLLGMRDRGLVIDPKLAIADGALGFWSALDKVYPTTKQQRCWVHKTANVLDKLPKSRQPAAKTALHEIYMADTKAAAEKAFDRFVEVYSSKYDRAAACLIKNREEMLAFYDFPAEHWRHIRTTNPIESTFATVRSRTRKTKGSGSARATLIMVFKLAQSAAKGWKKLNGSKLLADVIDARFKFVDGIKREAAA